MGARDPRVDAYIAKSPEFAQPVLARLREIVHECCPEVEETIKWSAPSFGYRGILCGMAAFKQYCAFVFWKGALLAPAGDRKGKALLDGLGRVVSVAELPRKRVLASYLRKAMRLNSRGVSLPRARRPKRKPPVAPADLRRALARNRKAGAAFRQFSPSHRREYIEWITEAKRDETRQRRLQTAVEWLAEGKARNWKYQR